MENYDDLDRDEIIYKCSVHGVCPYDGTPFGIGSYDSHVRYALSWIETEISISRGNAYDTLEEFRERIRSLVDMDGCLCGEAPECSCGIE